MHFCDLCGWGCGETRDQGDKAEPHILHSMLVLSLHKSPDTQFHGAFA